MLSMPINGLLIWENYQTLKLANRLGDKDLKERSKGEIKFLVKGLLIALFIMSIIQLMVVLL
jgi:hypothetical protein